MNMKRYRDRSISPRSTKMSRTSRRFRRSSDERSTPERNSRRQSSSSPCCSYREAPCASTSSYKILCVSELHPKASDELIKDILYREFKRFGDLTVKLCHDMRERMAYIYFKHSNEAKHAKQAKRQIIIYDRVASIKAVYDVSSRSEYYKMKRARSLTPEYDRSRRYSRSPEQLRTLTGHYDRGYEIPPPYYRDYRREPLSPPHLRNPYLNRSSIHHGRSYLPHIHGYGPPSSPLRTPFERLENRRDRYPNYLHHIQPEDDPLATRTLFVGNLELDIIEEDLRRIFDKYGKVEDIDIKRPLPGTGNAFAFVRFQTLDMAHKAKVNISGQYIGKYQCKIGYGKAIPTVRVWIAGLGPGTRVSQLKREFDKFGTIKRIDYIDGNNHAYIWYETLEAAQTAVREMRGISMGQPNRRLRTDFVDFADFADETEINCRSKSIKSHKHYESTEIDRSRSRSCLDSDKIANPLLLSTKTFPEVARACQIVWLGTLIIKSSMFPVKFHLLEGDTTLVGSLMSNQHGNNQWKITRKLRLDRENLEDVKKRIATAPSYAIFLGLGSSVLEKTENSTLQIRPFRNIITYLKQKHAAAVKPMFNEETDASGVLYCFPPCSFSNELLKRSCPNLYEEAIKEDHLVIVVEKQ